MRFTQALKFPTPAHVEQTTIICAGYQLGCSAGPAVIVGNEMNQRGTGAGAFPSPLPSATRDLAFRI
ncbi:hypothetical protein [Streptomyces yangpuensis]|uniref:hypothetical protein n=1 Tax=Streptomyces yangpuensis TaxID=1648182 RepID=UPI00365FC415